MRPNRAKKIVQNGHPRVHSTKQPSRNRHPLSVAKGCCTLQRGKVEIKFGESKFNASFFSLAKNGFSPDIPQILKSFSIKSTI